MALGVMGGAIVSHLTILGIVVQNDGGLLLASPSQSRFAVWSRWFCIAAKCHFISKWFKSKKA